jgi:hypothetical protein
LVENCDIARYIAALALFDGHYDIRPSKNYSLILADVSYEYLALLKDSLARRGIESTLRPGTMDRAWRLRIYGKDTILRLKALSEEMLRRPDACLLAAAIDAEGSIVTQPSQPLRVRIVLKQGPLADAVKRSLEDLGIPFKVYGHCRARGECGYVEFVISNKGNVQKLLDRVPLRHPIKLSRIYSRLLGRRARSPGRGCVRGVSPGHWRSVKPGFNPAKRR